MRVVVGVGAIVLLLAAPDAADAARISGDASTGPSATTVIVYSADPGERNRVSVRVRESTVTIVDRGARRIAIDSGNVIDCHAHGRQRVVCAAAPIDVHLGDRDDRIGFIPGGDRPDVPQRDPLSLAEDYTAFFEGDIPYVDFVVGGKGNDVITGSSGIDYVTPGPGRDSVDTRGGDDVVRTRPDGVRDRIRTGGGIDVLWYGDTVAAPLAIDLAAGTAGASGERDRIAGIERVHGGRAADTLTGSARGEGIYGESGSDRIDGAGGNDYLVGDAPDIGDRAFANEITGGAGDDVIDATGPKLAPTSHVDCGPGADTSAGEQDDLLAPSCEFATFRLGETDFLEEDPLFGRTPAFPVAVAADGTPTFNVRCPSAENTPHQSCRGKLALEQPPGAGARAVYGSGSFDIRPLAAADVRVALTPEGRAAIAAGSPVSAHVTADLANRKADFGWQLTIPHP